MGFAVLTSAAAAILRRAGLTAPLMGLAACGSHAAPPPPGPAQVGVVVANSQSVPLTRNLVGRLSATRSADVRARVAGVLLKRLYTEGSDVKEGQALFHIDPARLRAAFDGAQAALAQAEATATNAHVAAQRARELIASGVASRSDLDNAEATERSTAAAVQQAKAGVGTARINLGYATVTAPIAGRSGQQAVTEGALVGEGTAPRCRARARRCSGSTQSSPATQRCRASSSSSFRPILMTSFAFILGVFPMVVSHGAGANARHALGTGVVGGMLSAAVLGVLLIPVCYVAVRRMLGDKLDEPRGRATAASDGTAPKAET